MSPRTLRDQASIFLTEAASRRNPLSSNTLATYRDRIKNDILPFIGDIPLDVIDNTIVKALVGKWVEEEVSPATMRLNFTIIKQIQNSAVDAKGAPMYPVTWNPKFIQFPHVHSKKAAVDAQTVQDAISRLLEGECHECATLVALLAGSGLRIGEARALRLNTGSSTWIPQESKLVIREQRKRDGDFRQTKTIAGVREVDLAPELNQFLIRILVNNVCAVAPGSLLFPQSDRYYGKLLEEQSIPGFHALRRFRSTHLAGESCPDALSRYWAGHAAGDVHKGYEVFGKQIQLRKTEVVRIGLGFKLPEAI